jgi:hypothetical protein
LYCRCCVYIGPAANAKHRSSSSSMRIPSLHRVRRKFVFKFRP